MIGVVTVALLAGFGTLFLAERNRAPVVAQTPPPPAAIPASPGTVPEPQTATSSPTPDKSTSTQQNQSSSGETPPETVTTPNRPDEVAQTQTIPPVPKAPPVEEIKPPVNQTAPASQTSGQAAQSTSPAVPSNSTTPAQQAQTTPSAPAQAAPQAAPARAAVATSENRVPLRSDYRISLGSFGTRRTVESQTSGVRQLGYTVHAIDLGDQYVAQVGPFADEATARRALTDIQRSYPGALLYRPRSQTTTESTASDQTAPSSASAARSEAQSEDAPASTSARTPETATSSEPQTSSAPAPSGPTYLQVGAYSSAERAQGIVGTLHDNGFNPTVNSPEGKLTTVLVGPYSGDALLRAEARLDNAGLEHFRVR